MWQEHLFPTMYPSLIPSLPKVLHETLYCTFLKVNIIMVKHTHRTILQNYFGYKFMLVVSSQRPSALKSP